MANEINFDDLQREISAAEEYLKSRPQTTLRSSYAAPASSVVVSNAANVSASSDGKLHGASWTTSKEATMKAAVATTLQPDTPGTPDSLANNNDNNNNNNNNSSSGSSSSRNNQQQHKYRYGDIAASLEVPPQQLHPGSLDDDDRRPFAARDHEAQAWERGVQAAAAETSYSDLYTKQISTAQHDSNTEAEAAVGDAVPPEVYEGEGRYASESAREELIARLLAEHGSRSRSASGATTTSSVAATPQAKQQQQQQQQPFLVHAQEALERDARNDATIENYSRAYEEERAGAGAGADSSPPRGEDDDDDRSAYGVLSSPPRPALTDTLFFASDLHEGVDDEDHVAMSNFDGSLLHGVINSDLLGSGHGYGGAEGEDDDYVYEGGGDMEGGAGAGLAATLDRNVRVSANLVRAQDTYQENDPLSSGDGDDNGLGSGSVDDSIEGVFVPDKQAFPPTSQAWVIDAQRGKGGGGSGGSGGDVYARARAASGIPSRLQENQKRNWRFVKSREDCLKEGEEKLRTEYTFQPKLVTRERKHRDITPSTPGGSRPMQASTAQRSSPTRGGSKGQSQPIHSRIRDSVQSHENTLKTREKLRAHMGELEVSTCTFKPQISKMATKIMQRKEAKEKQEAQDALGGGGYDDPFATAQAAMGLSSAEEGGGHAWKAKQQQMASERLYGRAKVKAEQQEFLGKQVQKQRDALCTFQPAINPNTKAMYDNMERKFGMQVCGVCVCVCLYICFCVSVTQTHTQSNLLLPPPPLSPPPAARANP